MSSNLNHHHHHHIKLEPPSSSSSPFNTHNNHQRPTPNQYNMHTLQQSQQQLLAKYDQQQSNWRNKAKSELIHTSRTNMAKRLTHIVNQVNDSHELLKDFDLQSPDIKRMFNDVDNAINGWQGVDITSCKKAKTSFKAYKTTATNWFNRNKAKIYGNYFFSPLIFRYILNYCRDIDSSKMTENQRMDLFIDIFLKIVDGKITFQRTKAQPLLPYQTLIQPNDFRTKCKEFVSYYDVQWNHHAISPSKIQRKYQKDKFRSSKIFHSFIDCLKCIQSKLSQETYIFFKPDAKLEHPQHHNNNNNNNNNSHHHPRNQNIVHIKNEPESLMQIKNEPSMVQMKKNQNLYHTQSAAFPTKTTNFCNSRPTKRTKICSSAQSENTPLDDAMFVCNTSPSTVDTKTSEHSVNTVRYSNVKILGQRHMNDSLHSAGSNNQRRCVMNVNNGYHGHGGQYRVHMNNHRTLHQNVSNPFRQITNQQMVANNRPLIVAPINGQQNHHLLNRGNNCLITKSVFDNVTNLRQNNLNLVNYNGNINRVCVRYQLLSIHPNVPPIVISQNLI